MTQGLSVRRLVMLGGLVAVLTMGEWARADETGRSAADDGVELPRSAARPDRADTVPEGVVIPARLTLGEATKLFRAKGLDLLIADTTVETAQGLYLSPVG